MIHNATARIALLKPDSQEPHQTEHCRTSTFSALTLAKRQLVQSKPAVVDIRMYACEIEDAANLKESDDVPGLYPLPGEKRQAISPSQLLCHTETGKQIEGVKKFRRLHMIRHLPCHNFLDNQKVGDSLLVIRNGGAGRLITELETSNRSINGLLPLKQCLLQELRVFLVCSF